MFHKIMSQLAFLLLIILIIIIALYMVNIYLDHYYLQYMLIPNLPKIQLDTQARSEFVQFMNANPKLKEYEQRETNIPDITTQPVEYFRYELLEPEHRNTSCMLDERNNWTMNLNAIKNWEAEELAEIVHQKSAQVHSEGSTSAF